MACFRLEGVRKDLGKVMEAVQEVKAVKMELNGANDYKFSAKIKRGLLSLDPFFNPYLWNGYPLLSLPGEFG